MVAPTATLIDKVLLRHWHNLLVRNLPGLDLNVNQATGTRIAENIGEVSIKLQKDKEDWKTDRGEVKKK